MPPNVAPLGNLEEAERAFERVREEIDAVSPDSLSPQNVELMAATSTAIGAEAAIVTHRDSIAKLFGTEIRCVDHLGDYAKATWFLYITNLPLPSTPSQLEEEVLPLRAKLLRWAVPLAESGIFSQAAIDRIREGSGIREAASDIVALAMMYRNAWDQVRTMCGVTEEDLERASKVGAAVFAAVSRRETQPVQPTAESTLRVRKAWTLLDHAYTECRRAIGYLRYAEGDVDTIAPNLRRNQGTTRRTPESPAPAEPATPSPIGPTPITVGPPVGGGGSPFINK